MNALDRWFYSLMLASMRFERDIGASTGMNPGYLAGLSVAIRDMERDLMLSEANRGR